MIIEKRSGVNWSFKSGDLTVTSFIGTEATCAAITHLIKVIVFSFAEMVLLREWKLIVPMAIASIAGSFTGKLILGRMRQDIFVWIVRVIITLVALRMLVRSFS